MATPPPKGLPPGFLSEAAGTDTSFRPPPRRSCRVTPLIDGTKTAIEIERAVLDAESTIYMAYWDLSLDIEPQSPEAKALGYSSMMPLLFDAVSRGVDVRIFLTDADPLADIDVHRDSWTVYRALTAGADARASSDPTFDRQRFQVVCALPAVELEAGSLRGMIGTPALRVLFFTLIESGRLTLVTDALNAEATSNRAEAIRKFSNSPGLWEDLDLTSSTTEAFASRGFLPRPLGAATHHVKLTIVDGTKAILGGSNLNSRIVDNTRHELPDLTHDLNCLVEGDVVGDLIRAFQGLWDLSFGTTATFLAVKNPSAPHSSLEMPLCPATALGSVPPPRTRPDVSVVQLIRTSTGLVTAPPAGSGRAPTPALLRGDTELAYEAAITGAKKYIYIENQYFRWPQLGEWLKAALVASPQLTLIVLLPARPEEGNDPFTHHGMLTRRLIMEKLTAIAPGRVGFFTLESKTPADPTNPLVGQAVYVHSKALIVDDEFALIGSANLNGRSFRVDTEIGIAWHHRKAIRKFRLMLWSHLLGRSPTDIAAWKPATFAGNWLTIAGLHVGLPAPARGGFVVPLMDPPASALPRNPLVDELAVRLPTPTAEQFAKDLEPLLETFSNIADEKPAPVSPRRNRPRQPARNV